MNPHEKSSPSEGQVTSRRQFLHQATGLAAGAALLDEISVRGAETAQPNTQVLPRIKLGEHQITRLIIGGNPIYGYSHFNRILSQYQTHWHTPERVIELLQHAESHGINTWQNSYAERTLSDLES